MTVPTKITLLNQLQKCLDDKSIIEVITDTNEISGQLSVIGKDYIGITSSSERNISSIAVGQDGTKEKQEHIEVYSLESFIKFEDIKVVSRVLKKTIK